MSQRLPTPGSDSGTWGDVLNGFLGVVHNTDGTLLPATVGATVIDATGATSTYVLTANAWGTASWAAAAGGSDKLGLTPTAVKTTNYSAAAGDFVPVDTTSGSVTVTLPTAPANGTVVAIKHVIQGSTNTVGLALGGSDVFNKAGGSTTGTITLVSQGILVQYKSSGAIWYVIADDLPLSGLDLRYLGIAASAGGGLTGTYPNPTLAAGSAGATVLASGAATANQVPLATGWGSVTWGSLNGASLAITDVTTNNVTSSQHGFAPKSGADATTFLNGATTPAYAQVKDSDLATTDITTNNVSTSKHGFAPKLDNTSTHFLNGQGAWTTPSSSGVPATGRGLKSGGSNYLLLPGVASTGQTTQTQTINRANYTPIYVVSSITLANIVFEVTTNQASSHIRCGIYNADTSWQPTSLVSGTDTGDVATASNGVKTTACTAVLAAGRYLIWNNADTVGIVLRAATGNINALMGFQPALGATMLTSQTYVAQTYGSPPGTGLVWATDSGSSSNNSYSWPIFLDVGTP